MSTTVLDPVFTTVIDRVEAEERIGDPLFSDPVDMVALRGSSSNNTYAFIVDMGWHRVIYGKTKSNNSIWEYLNSIGSFGTSDTEAKFQYPTAIASDIVNNNNDRYVYVADSWNNQVVQLLFSPSSQTMTFVRNITGFQYPRDVDVHNNGTKTNGSDDWLWVLDYSGKSIYEINNDGTERAHHSSYRNSSGSLVPFRYPKKFTIKQTGSGTDQNVIYVLEDNGKTVLGLSIDAPDGYLLEIFSYSFPEGTSITNIESDEQGDILLVEYDNHLFHKLSSQGEYFCSYGGYSLDIDGFKYPQVVTNIRGKDITVIGEGWSDNSGGKVYYSGADVVNMLVTQIEWTYTITIDYTLTNRCYVSAWIEDGDHNPIMTLREDELLPSGPHSDATTLSTPGSYFLVVEAIPINTSVDNPQHSYWFFLDSAWPPKPNIVLRTKRISGQLYPKLTWSQYPDGPFNFDIYRRKNLGSWITIGSTTNHSYIDNSMVIDGRGDRQVDYYIIAINGVTFEESAPSNTVTTYFSGPIRIDRILYEQEKMSEHYSLEPNIPNLFNPITTIQYTLPERSFVNFEVFDILGRYVTKLVFQEEPPGYKKVQWNGINDNGKAVPSGMYIYVITANSLESNQSFHQVRKMVLLR